MGGCPAISFDETGLSATKNHDMWDGRFEVKIKSSLSTFNPALSTPTVCTSNSTCLLLTQDSCLLR